MRSSGMAILRSALFLFVWLEVEARFPNGYGNRRQANILTLREEPEYVTREEFDATVNILVSSINTVTTEVDAVARNVTVLRGRLDKDHCADSPCQNNGVCNNGLHGYTCDCKPSYIGHNCEQATGLLVSKVLAVDNGNHEGSWADWALCPVGYYTRTFRIKLEDDQGGAGDDTAANNIRMMCTCPVTHDDYEIKSGYGPFGTWRSWTDCPTGEFIVGFSLKVEPDQGGKYDDSAVNGMTVTCTGGSQQTGEIGGEGSFGSTAKCPENSAICGIKTRIEPNQGSHDDSGLNDVQMMCCAL